MYNICFNKSEIMQSVKERMVNENTDYDIVWNKAFKSKLEESLQDIKDYYEQNTKISLSLANEAKNSDPLSYHYRGGELYNWRGQVVTEKFPLVAQISKKIYGDLNNMVHMSERFADDLLGIK